MAKYGKTKNPYAREQWIQNKRKNRPKQIWAGVHGWILASISDIAGYLERLNQENPDFCQYCGNISPGNQHFCGKCESRFLGYALYESF